MFVLQYLRWIVALQGFTLTNVTGENPMALSPANTPSGWKRTNTGNYIQSGYVLQSYRASLIRTSSRPLRNCLLCSATIWQLIMFSPYTDINCLWVLTVETFYAIRKHIAAHASHLDVHSNALGHTVRYLGHGFKSGLPIGPFLSEMFLLF